MSGSGRQLLDERDLRPALLHLRLGIPVWVSWKNTGSQRVSRLCNCELAAAITATEFCTIWIRCFCTAFIAEHGILSALFELHRLLIERGFRRSSRDDRQFRPAIGAPAPPDEEDERVSWWLRGCL